jgi:hypothetical protein
MARGARIRNSRTGQTGMIERPRPMLVRLTGELAERYARRFAGPAAGPLEDPGLARFDLVLLPSRSVSVLWALLQVDGDPDAQVVLDVLEAAVEQAVGYVEEALEVELPCLGFAHRYSSTGDPLLHAHVIVGPMVHDPCQGWVPVAGDQLAAHVDAAVVVYRDAYQRELTNRFGVDWTSPDRHGDRELIGLDERLLRGFSRPCRPLWEVEACR